jgi:hypothetical protein
VPHDLIHKEDSGQVKQRFLVHFVSPGDFDLDAYLHKLAFRYALTDATNASHGVRSILIEIEPSVLREVIKNIPRSVAVSYEEKEPEQC